MRIGGSLQLTFPTHVSRTVMLREVASCIPACCQYAEWCYKQETPLYGVHGKILSSTGIQQGDVLGPALYAAAQHSILVGLKALEPDWVVGFLDDTNVCGKLDVLERPLQLLAFTLISLNAS